MSSPELLEVGRIGRPHGVRGDLYVDLVTDRVERLDPGTSLWVRGEQLQVERSKSQGTRWIVHFRGVDDRTAAERLVSATLHAEPIEDPDELWAHELIGARVVEVDGTERGTCVAVVANPASDLLELDSGALVPVVFVQSQHDGTITIDPPDGLFDE
jgi:16S rRNA processing protein RimM